MKLLITLTLAIMLSACGLVKEEIVYVCEGTRTYELRDPKRPFVLVYSQEKTSLETLRVVVDKKLSGPNQYSFKHEQFSGSSNNPIRTDDERNNLDVLNNYEFSGYARDTYTLTELEFNSISGRLKLSKFHYPKANSFTANKFDAGSADIFNATCHIGKNTL